MSSFDLTKNWIISSGLVINNQQNENLGGVHSFYDEKDKQYGFLYPEITGYFISALRFLHSTDENPNYISLAKNSADWLMTLEKTHGGIIQGVNKNSTEKLVYSFDTGICATGILDCYYLTKNEKYLKFALKLTDWISNEALTKVGILHPVKDLSTNNFFEDSKLWYKQFGCLHLKTAIPFFKLYQITKDESKLDIAKTILENYYLFKNKDGIISLHQNSSLIHLHSLCYALEGLIYGYHVTNDEKYLNYCESALKWCNSHLEDDGSIQLWFNSSFTNAKTSYHIAQLIRLMILFNKIKQKDIFQKSIESLFNFMSSLHITNGSEKIKGGFYEEFYKSFMGWKKRNKVNSWGTLFALQAIYMKENYEKISFHDFTDYLY